MSVICDRSVVFSGSSGFLHQLNWSSRHSWTIVESGVKHHQANKQRHALATILSDDGVFSKDRVTKVYFICVDNEMWISDINNHSGSFLYNSALLMTERWPLLFQDFVVKKTNSTRKWNHICFCFALVIFLSFFVVFLLLFFVCFFGYMTLKRKY